jgi:hypothetical protein
MNLIWGYRSTWLALLVLVVAGGFLTGGAVADAPPCGGLLQPPCPSTTTTSSPTTSTGATPIPVTAPPERASISLRASREIALCAGDRYSCRFTQLVFLTGRVTGIRDPAGLVVGVVAYSPAYRRSVLIKTRADSSGRFRTSMRPPLNVVLNAQLTPGQRAVSDPSRARVVIVLPRVRPSAGPVISPPGDVVFFLYVSAPVSSAYGSPRAGRARAVFYVSRASGGIYHRVASAPFAGVGVGTDAGRHAYSRSFPPNALIRRSKYVFGCVKGLAFQGIGVPFPACGQPTLRLHR